jgi:hypothetical protein
LRASVKAFWRDQRVRSRKQGWAGSRSVLSKTACPLARLLKRGNKRRDWL